MKKGNYEILGKHLEIEVDSNQIDVFQEACAKINQQLVEFKRFDLNKADISILLNLAVEAIQQKNEIDEISKKLDIILEDDNLI